MLVIGDVCGKGPRAASVTALARYTLRAAAMSGHTPVEMLGVLHRALLDQGGPSEMCTVCLALLEPGEQEAGLTIALAGHPPPLLIRRAGEIEQVGRIGTLLGMIDPVTLEPAATTLRGGDTLLLYTDGVTDAGADGRMIGEDGLRALCTSTQGAALPRLLRLIEQAAVERSRGSLRDDLALLAVRAAPPSAAPLPAAPDAELETAV
jgi:serine phosphatase RsbU (regulator of sigma subunit)